MFTEEIQKYVKELLSKHWKQEIEIEIKSLLGGSKRSEVYRCAIKNATDEIPTSIIIKFYVQTENESESDALERIQKGFISEWSGLAFLGSHENIDISPALILGDKKHSFVVLEDLGEVLQLDHILRRNNPKLAKRALVELAKTLAIMHGTTLGKREIFATQQQETTSIKLIEETDLWQKFPDHLAYLEKALSLKVPQEVMDEIEATKIFFNNDNPLCTYSHSDPCPDNCVWHDGKIKLIDFERGAFRHAFLDAVYGRIHFPTCWCVGVIPREIYIEMEHVYKDTLATYYPAILNNRLFEESVVIACAWYMVKSIKEGIFDTDKDWGIATVRQRMITRFERFSEISQEYNFMQATGRWTEDIAKKMKDAWILEENFEPLKLYPAFSGETS